MKGKTDEEKITLDVTQITPKSSLGLLAYGDIAFKAWRELKIKLREIENEK